MIEECVEIICETLSMVKEVEEERAKSSKRVAILSFSVTAVSAALSAIPSCLSSAFALLAAYTAGYGVSSLTEYMFSRKASKEWKKTIEKVREVIK